MVLYLDASAIVKRYVEEPGSEIVAAALSKALVRGTSVASAAEVAAALKRTIRVGRLAEEDARQLLSEFRQEWPGYHLVELNDALGQRASELAWQHALRGYDAVHLASAIALQRVLGEEVAVATFDRDLAKAARSSGLATLPDDLEAFFASVRR